MIARQTPHAPSPRAGLFALLCCGIAAQAAAAPVAHAVGSLAPITPSLVLFQGPAGPAGPSNPGGSAPAPRPRAAGAEVLRTRIHDMRMNLLLGGDAVRNAEREAIGFYADKAALVDDRLDTIEVETAEKHAAYDVALSRALEAPNLERKRQATGEAAQLRAERSALEDEKTGLQRKREGLSQMIAAVEARDRDRERLVTQLETSSGFDQDLGMPLFSIGLAPVAEAIPASSPFEDDALIADLMARDPRAARELLFELDPGVYWQRFPLQPPQQALHQALAFPLPDLPGNR